MRNKILYGKTNISSLAEQMVCSFINDLLADDEEIKVEYVLPEVKKGLRYIADIYLPQGCRKLKVKPKSVIEIKTVVLFDTVYRYKNLFDNCKKEWNVGDFISYILEVVYQNIALNLMSQTIFT